MDEIGNNKEVDHMETLDETGNKEMDHQGALDKLGDEDIRCTGCGNDPREGDQCLYTSECPAFSAAVDAMDAMDVVADTRKMKITVQTTPESSPTYCEFVIVCYYSNNDNGNYGLRLHNVLERRCEDDTPPSGFSQAEWDTERAKVAQHLDDDTWKILGPEPLETE